MRCKAGDIARIIYSIRPENVGRIVKVKEYIGKFNANEDFDFRGMTCKCIVPDHYWWIEADDLSILLGPSPQAYIADSWLEPLRSNEKDTTEEAQELDILGMGIL